ncbi:MAG: glycosyltransferase [Acidobacteriota bacterium]
MLSSNHRYPAFAGKGSGFSPRQWSSGSAHHIQDLIVKGLVELGHDVFYLPSDGASEPLPLGATLITEPVSDVDIYHNIAYRDQHIIDFVQSLHKPWVTSCHLDLGARGRERIPAGDNWIFVSRTLARSYGKNRYVLNGIDPSDYVYSETKGDYFLFMCAMDWHRDKGLDIALELSEKAGFELIVAGTAKDSETISEVARMCERAGALYVGDVRGPRKSELLARARALLFPSRINEAFGLTIVEALMSGTPAIASNNGACPEIVSSEVGFVCSNEDEYIRAVERIGLIRSRDCREKAVREFHYLRMTADYVKEYEKEIASR